MIQDSHSWDRAATFLSLDQIIAHGCLISFAQTLSSPFYLIAPHQRNWTINALCFLTFWGVEELMKPAVFTITLTILIKLHYRFQNTNLKKTIGGLSNSVGVVSRCLLICTFLFFSPLAWNFLQMPWRISWEKLNLIRFVYCTKKKKKQFLKFKP